MNKPTDDYNSISRYYDFFLTLPMRSIRRRIVKEVARLQPSRVLDFCCGTGQQLRLLEGRGFDLAGVDASPGMVKVARRKCSADTAIILADATDLPMEDSTVDCAIFSMALHELSPSLRSAMINEARRVVRGQGTLLIADYRSPVGRKAAFFHKLVHFVESRTEGDHFKNFQQWMEAGAVEGFVQELSMPARWLSVNMAGNCAVVALENEKPPAE